MLRRARDVLADIGWRMVSGSRHGGSSAHAASASWPTRAGARPPAALWSVVRADARLPLERTVATRVTLTYADYAAIPNDGRRYEVHEGELAVTPAPSPRHQQVSRNLLVLLHAHVARHGLGEILDAPIDCILDDTTVVQPDLVFVARDRLAAISARGIEGAPDLVVEVLSPRTAQIDRGVKAQLYARHGVPCYWIVDPEARVIEVHVLRAGAYGPAGRLEGTRPAALPPFSELALDPAAVWP